MDKGFLVVRAIVILSIILFSIDYFVELKKGRSPKVAVVLDLSKSAKQLKEFYEEVLKKLPKGFEIYSLGDSIYKFEKIEFIYDGTNLNALNYLKDYDYIIYIGDGWHNYGFLNLKYDKPIYFMIPDEKKQIFIKDIVYPKFASEGENVSIFLNIYSTKDTSLNVQIDGKTSKIHISKGENLIKLDTKADESIILKVGNNTKALKINLSRKRRTILMNIYEVSPEISILKNYFESKGYDVILNLKGEEFEDYDVSIGFYGENGEDIVFLKKQGFNIFKLNGRYFVNFKNGWLYRNDDRVKTLLDSLNEILNLIKPNVEVSFKMVGSKAYFEVRSDLSNLEVFVNGVKYPRNFVVDVNRDTVIQIKASYNGKTIYRKQFSLKSKHGEDEMGINYELLKYISERSGGKRINNFQFESITEMNSLKISNLIIPWIIVLVLFIGEIGLRRFKGFV